MKNYTITVNGNVYDVTVEEKAAGAVSAASNKAAPAPAAAASAPVPAQAAAPAVTPAAAAAPAQAAAPAAAASGGTGSVKIEAGAAGKVFKVEASIGQHMKKGDTVLILEAMKMEIPVVAPEDGTIASINAAVGDAVEAGAILATLN